MCNSISAAVWEGPWQVVRRVPRTHLQVLSIRIQLAEQLLDGAIRRLCLLRGPLGAILCHQHRGRAQYLRTRRLLLCGLGRCTQRPRVLRLQWHLQLACLWRWEALSGSRWCGSTYIQQRSQWLPAPSGCQAETLAAHRAAGKSDQHRPRVCSNLVAPVIVYESKLKVSFEIQRLCLCKDALKTKY